MNCNNLASVLLLPRVLFLEASLGVWLQILDMFSTTKIHCKETCPIAWWYTARFSMRAHLPSCLAAARPAAHTKACPDGNPQYKEFLVPLRNHEIEIGPYWIWKPQMSTSVISCHEIGNITEAVVWTYQNLCVVAALRRLMA